MQIRLPADSKMQSPDFVFGVATSSYQIEGAYEQRLPCIWDVFSEREGAISDGSDGRVACDHVHRWREDVALMASLGVDAYRLSISWPRVVNADGSANDDGLDFYKSLLDGLLEHKIKPFVTLYHWDLPQHLEDAGGWQNRDTVKRFQDYTDLVTRALGDRVFSYATLNEPFCSAYLGYEVGIHAPGISCKVAGKQAAHHLLLAHGLAMQVLETNSPASENGIVLNFTPAYPASDSPQDVAAAALADEANNQWYLRPIIEGAYPALIDRLPGEQVPDIQAGDLELIAHPLDYLGVNYYTRGVYCADEKDGYRQLEPQGSLTAMGWEIYPQGLTDLLVDLNRNYSLPPIYVAENGVALADEVVDGEIDDHGRIGYLQSHLEAVNAALEAGVDIKGYFCWSLMDNFEWAYGYSKHFGLVHVDHQTQRRTVKASGLAYRDLLRQRDSVAA